MNFMNYLNYRSDYERIVSGFVLPEDKYQGTINSMQWFLEKGHTANRFRKGFNEALEVCQKVIDDPEVLVYTNHTRDLYKMYGTRFDLNDFRY